MATDTNNSVEPPDPRGRIQQLLYLRTKLEELAKMSGDKVVESLNTHVFPLLPTSLEQESCDFDTMPCLEEDSEHRLYRATETGLYRLLRKSIIGHTLGGDYTEHLLSQDFRKAYSLMFGNRLRNKKVFNSHLRYTQMNLLALGDFHGTFSSKFKKIIKKHRIDIVISNGDYFPFHYRKIWFKHCYGTNTFLWEVIGKSNYRQLIKKDLADGEKTLKKLDNLSVPVLTVYGNIDYTRKNDSLDIQKPKGEKYFAWDWQDFFSPIVKKYKDIHRIDYSFFTYKEYIFIGMSGGSAPGEPKSRSYKKHKAMLQKIFKKFKKELKNKKVILISHNVPNNTRLDKIGMHAHSKVRGKHYGSKLVREIINIYKPIMAIGGHIHEGRGTQMLGKTLIINPGSAHEGRAAIIKINSKNTSVTMV